MWLGVDIGTGGSRALVVDAAGRIVAGVTVGHEEILMQQPLWAEQRPENWWTPRWRLYGARWSGQAFRERTSKASVYPDLRG